MEKFYSVCVYNMLVEVRETGVTLSLLAPCGFWGWNSGCSLAARAFTCQAISMALLQRVFEEHCRTPDLGGSVSASPLILTQGLWPAGPEQT